MLPPTPVALDDLAVLVLERLQWKGSDVPSNPKVAGLEAWRLRDLAVGQFLFSFFWGYCWGWGGLLQR